jgi:hypothetical protein
MTVGGVQVLPANAAHCAHATRCEAGLGSELTRLVP